MKKLLLFLASFLLMQFTFAQRSEWKTISLTDLSAFKEQAGNWQVVGGVSMDPSINVKDVAEVRKAAAEWATLSKKERKKWLKSGKPEPVVPQLLYPEAGTGILLNDNNDEQRDNLFTTWEHADMELEAEVMVPKNSNSGLYFQGRYEIQVRDSWGKKTVKFGDMGGIYRSWIYQNEKDWMGKPPFVNAAKAPGLWQHVKVGFEAPKFDAAGNKISNARFVYVDLNGIRVHENVEVPSPTRSGLTGEVAKGPLMIQGDHGPVAIRNLRYRILEQKPVRLTDVHYQLFEGNFNGFDEFAEKAPDAEGDLSQLTINVPEATSAMALKYTGNVEVESAGTYHLRFDYSGNGGGAYLKVGDKMVGKSPESADKIVFEIALPAGKTPFEIGYFRSSSWSPGIIGLYNYGSWPVPLHNPDSYLPGSEPAKNQKVYVETGSEPRLLRAFLDFEGDNEKRLTHTLGVAHPSELNYVYDLKTGSPACVWHGPFVDATPMWDGRGDGSFQPRGAVEWLFTGHSVAKLPSADAAFPEALNEANGFKNLGYRIAEDSNLPVFQYRWGETTFEDALLADAEGKYLIRHIQFPENPSSLEGWYVKLAEGSKIEKLPNGYYTIDQQWYVAPEGFTPTIREQGGKKELIAPLTTSGLQYGIIW